MTRSELLAALEGHELFSGTDPAAAARQGFSLFGRHRFVVRDPQCRFAATLHALATGPITLGRLHLGYSAELVVHATAPRFLVVAPLDGVTTTAAVIQPGRPTAVVSPVDGAYLVVGIEEQALLVHLSRLTGRAPDHPLVFDPELRLSVAGANRWNVAVATFRSELSEGASLLRSGIGAGQLEEFLMSSLLYGHRSTYSEILSQPAGLERRAVTAARSFIDANLSDRLTLGAVASAAGVSVRTLQASFRSELRTTPTSYIRSRRLDRAHSELRDPQAATVTVTDIATRWGIAHLGRFAAEYRTRYGETPSQTLRRHRH